MAENGQLVLSKLLLRLAPSCHDFQALMAVGVMRSNKEILICDLDGVECQLQCKSDYIIKLKSWTPPADKFEFQDIVDEFASAITHTLS